MGGMPCSGVGVLAQPSCPLLNLTATLWQLKLIKTFYNPSYRKSVEDLRSHFSVSLQNIILIKTDKEQFHTQETEKLLFLKEAFKVPHPPHKRSECLPSNVIAPCTITKEVHIYIYSQPRWFTVSASGSLPCTTLCSLDFNATNTLQKAGIGPQMGP